MNRPIKFRAWDGKSMFHDVRLAGGYEAWAEAVMQFTGLTDAEGREIYEGDILRRAKDGDNYKFYIVVEFSNGCFGGATRPGSNHYLRAHEWGSCDYDGGGYDEVIGNIYENPELLDA